MRKAKNYTSKDGGIETRFDDLKNKFKIENFSGEKPVIIEQDFYATILLSNLASLLKQGKQEKQFRQLIKELQRNIVPVIKGRTFERTKLKVANRYSKNKRRSL